MGKAKKRTVFTIVFMLVLAVVIIVCYYYWANRTKPITSQEDNPTEAEKLIDKDLENYYPETPKEVTKLFASMIQVLYSKPKEDDVEPLALKIRQLYDDELLKKNPEDTYLKNLVTELAEWKAHGRSISNYILPNEDKNEDNEVNGEQYSVKYVSYTILQKTRFTETWKVILRQDDNKHWKILGWELVPDEDTDKND